MRWFIALVPIVFSVATLPAQESTMDTSEKPSAELIVEA